MADDRKSDGRGRLAYLLGKIPRVGPPPTDPSSDNEDVPAVQKPIGRAEFFAKMREKTKKEKAKTEAEGSSGTSTEVEPSEMKSIQEKMKQMKTEEKEGVDSKPVIIEKQGQFGEEKILSTNYIRLNTDPSKRVFEYEINFEPTIPNIGFRYKLVYKQFHDKRDILCYDGGNRLFTPEKITTSSIMYDMKHPTDASDVVLCVVFKKVALAKDCAFIYNILFRNFARILQMTRFRDKFYDHKAALKIPQHKLEIWPGVVTNVEEFDGGIQLRCDINHRVLRTETAHDVIVNTIKRNPENFKVVVGKELLGECVSTNYNNNLYRVDDIEWNQSPLSFFEISNGQKINFVEYYKKQYNVDIRDLRQPLLISRKKNQQGQKSQLICLVPELCNMTGLTDKMTSDMRVMKDVALYTRVTPAQRTYAFRKFLSNIKSNAEAQEMLKRWGLTIQDDPVKVVGRNLLSEKLIFGNNSVVTAVNGDWQKCFKDVTVYQSVDLLNWLLFFPEREFRTANKFANFMRKVGPGLGIDISEPNKVGLRDDRNETYIAALRKYVDSRVQMVVCICPTLREDRYSAIKKFCCNEVPVPSQVINCVTLAREDRLRSVVQNIALQINVKLGGASWAINIPFKNSMICGVDIYHDKMNNTAVVGFVASCNAVYTEWFSRTVFQGPKEEIVGGLVQAFSAALRNYFEKINSYPDRVVVYRDGLSEGQMQVCRDFEVSQFLKACKDLTNNMSIKFTYVVVRKRISTKVFQMVGKNNEMVNPSSGDVIDQTITNKSFYDFFLVSQYVRVGTATPCHYVVLYDNSNIKPDHIQRLTYKFCHLYYNWPGTVRVPAPCYYAHKLAYLVGQTVKTVPSKSLENKLYYL